MPARQLIVRLGDHEVSVTLGEAGRAEFEEGTAQAVEIAPGEWRVTIDGRAHRLFLAGPPDAPWIWHDGLVYRPDVVDPRVSVRARRREAAADLAAPMPATVRAIHVGPGDVVTRGQTLVVLEAMKMELPLKAPADGTVASLACRVGDLVQPGVPLVVIA